MNKYVDIFRKSIVDFLIAFYVSFGDIYHSFAVKRRNVTKLMFFTYHLPITPKFRALRGDPWQKSLHFLKLEELSFQMTYEPQL
jgi:hypothetical protein